MNTDPNGVMCGRYSLTTPPQALAKTFGLKGALPNLAPRYNIAPTQSAPVVRMGEAGRELILMRWGLVPFWAKDGGPERTMAALADPHDRKKMKAELNSRSDIQSIWHHLWLHNFRQPQNVKYDGKTLWQIAEMREQDPADAMFDLLLEERLGISEVGLGTNAHTLPAFVSHPYGMIASDAILFGEYPNPRTYGCFPVVLAEFVRAEKHLKLPEAIRKMTSFPAQRLGLPDRGVLRDGFRADIVIFNPDTVRTDATKDDPKHYPVGIDYVIVNGVVVIQNGTNTGATPGRALRRGH